MFGEFKRRIKSLQDGPAISSDSIDHLRIQMGSLESRLLRSATIDRLRDAEFSVYSQFGEDGIIQYLLTRVAIPPDSERFVECGVADYSECNTRFLLVHDNWEGLIIDSEPSHLRFLEGSELRWRHTIEARQEFVTRDNLPQILEDAGVGTDFGLLSIDLDGNDYWVWEGLTSFRPLMVVIEYNSLFGPMATVSVPYDPDFSRAAAHPSYLYWGASLAAFVHLGSAKGYRFVGSNSAGNNAFFVRDDVPAALTRRRSEEEWVPSRFRESRGTQGELTYVTSLDARRRSIADMPLVDVANGMVLSVRDLPEPP